MRRAIEPDLGQLISAQTTDLLYGTLIAAAKDAETGIYSVVDNAGNPEIARGVISIVSGWLRVHLVDSFSNNSRTTKVYRDVPVFVNTPMGYVFDEIDVDNSTAALFLTTVVSGSARQNMVVCL